MKKIILNVKSIECKGCEDRIQNALKGIKEIEEIVANHENGTVTIIAKEETKEDMLKEKINNLGFEVEE